MSFGAAQYAISVIKQNRSLNKKHRKKGLGLSGDESIITEYDLPKISEQEILLLRNKLRLEHRQTRVKQVLLLSIIMAILVATFIYFA